MSPLTVCAFAVVVAWQTINVIQTPPGMPPPRDATQKTGTARIRGHVVAADTGQPLRRAQVRAFAQEIRETRGTSTDANGAFEIKDLPAGRYTVSASKGSFVSLQYGQVRPFSPGKPLELHDGETANKVDFALPRGAVITGHVSDEFGEPIADVSVMPMRYQFAQGRRRLVPAGRGGNTNDIGEYRIFGLPPGQYYLSATLRNATVMMNGDSDDRSGYAPTYYPGTPSMAEAQRIAVGVGQTLSETNLALIPTRTAKVTGTAVDSAGKPLSGGFVMVMQSIGGPGSGSVMSFSSSGGQVRPDGSFTVAGLAPGEYTFRAQPNGPFDSSSEVASARVVVSGEDVSGVQLVGQKPVAVTGRIILPTGASSFQPSALRIMTTPADPDQMMIGPSGGGGRINDDLTFELKMQPGRALVRLFGGAASDWTLKAVRFNGMDATDTGIEVKGEDTSGLEVEITNQQNQVIGTVSSARGEPLKDYTVVVFARDRERWSLPQTRYIRQAQPDQNGQFKVTGLPGGDYYAVAVDNLEPGEGNDPEFLDRVRDRATPFTLADGAAQALTLKIVSST